MYRQLMFTGLLAGSVLACGHATNLYSTQQVSTALQPDSVFACARAQLKSLNYSQTALDIGDHRVAAKVKDPNLTVSDVQFRGGYNAIEVKVDAGGANGQTDLKITARTYFEYFTQRGTTLEEKDASEDVKRDSHTIADACTSAGSSESAPGTASPDTIRPDRM